MNADWADKDGFFLEIKSVLIRPIRIHPRPILFSSIKNQAPAGRLALSKFICE